MVHVGTKWLGQQLPAPTRIVLDYGVDDGGVDNLVSPHAFVIKAAADGSCDPAQSYNPPTAFSFARSDTGAAGSWDTVQTYEATVGTFNFGWCCTLASVTSAEPGCLRVTEDVTDTSVHTNRFTVEVPFVAARYFAFEITDALGSRSPFWSTDPKQPSIAEIELHHVPDYVTTDANIPAYLHFNGVEGGCLACSQHAVLGLQGTDLQLGEPTRLSSNTPGAFTIVVHFRRDGAGIATKTDSRYPDVGIQAVPLLAKGCDEPGEGTETDINYFLGLCDDGNVTAFCQ